MSESGWIEWKWSKHQPYPEPLETVVDVRFADGVVMYGETVGYWAADGKVSSSCWRHHERMAAFTITHYRVRDKGEILG